MDDEPEDDKPTPATGSDERRDDHRYKPGQSGCPDGGWRQRRENLKNKKKKKKKPKTAWEIFRDIANETVTVTLKSKDQNGNLIVTGSVKRTRFEQAVRATFTSAAEGDRHTQKLILEYQKAAEKYILPPEDGKKTGVLVVYPTLSEEQWEKETEGQMLTKNPLEGLIGEELGLPGASEKLKGRSRPGLLDDSVFGLPKQSDASVPSKSTKSDDDADGL